MKPMRPTLCFACLSITVFAGISLPARAQDEKPAATNPPVYSVSMTFDPSMSGADAPFGIKLSKDGSAIYVTKRAKEKGTYKATGLATTFERLAKAVNDANYWSLPDRMGQRSLAHSSLTIKVVSPGSSRSVIDAGRVPPHTFGRNAPKQLKLVEQILSEVIHTAHWTKIGSKADLASVQSAPDRGD